MAQSKKAKRRPLCRAVATGIRGVCGVETDRLQVARNPVSRAIERAALNRHRISTLAEMRAMPDWAHCPSLLQGVAEAIACAIKTIEGFDDPDSLGDAMVDAMDVITDLAAQGQIWRTGKPADALINAFDIACLVLAGMPPEEKLKAWAWAQRVESVASLEAAA